MNKHVLEPKHIDFFDKNGWVLFQDLLPVHMLSEYKALLAKICTTRNVWKHNELIKKLSFNYTFAYVAAQLSRLKQLRFGFDHYFPSLESVSSFFSKGPSLTAVNSIDRLEIGLLLNLSDTQTSTEEHASSAIPTIGGSGTFFSATSTPFDMNVKEISGPFLLITYCHTQARYLYKVSDPFTHDVKKESCAFGDRLANNYHPLVYY